MDLIKAIKLSTAGMKAQGVRLRVISENIANADSLPESPGAQPYRRRMVTFKNVLDRKLGADKVEVDRIVSDHTKFKKKYDPGYPGADKNGYVLLPNVNPLVEMMDMREAERSYQANLNIVQVTKSMLNRTIDMLRN